MIDPVGLLLGWCLGFVWLGVCVPVEWVTKKEQTSEDSQKQKIRKMQEGINQRTRSLINSHQKRGELVEQY